MQDERSLTPVMKAPKVKGTMINFYSYLVAFIMVTIGVIIHLYAHILNCDDLDKSKENLKKLGYIMLGIGALTSLLAFVD